MNLIVAVDEAWGIGKDGDLLRRISADMKNFRAITTGHALVMGRKTLESFPNGKPLPHREHIVLTTNPNYACEGITLCKDIEELKEVTSAITDKKIFVVGGGSVYQQLLPLCDIAYVTKIHHTFPADTYFPNLDEMEEWSLREKGELQTEGDISFAFDIYVKK